MAGSGVAPAGAKILIVDDNPTNLRLLMEVLETRHHSVLVATSGAKALQLASQARPDLILLDVMMPEMDGYEVCRRLKSNPATVEVPVVFITANDQAESIVTGFNAGAVDYIPKPFRQEEVLARVQAHIDVHRLTRELEQKNQTLEETNRQLKQAHEELDQAQKRLITELRRELQTAHDLQMGLMPAAPPRLVGYELAGLCSPATHVGGDLFQYFQRDNVLAVGIADITGHAMEAAIPAVMFSGILESEMHHGEEIAERFARLNRTLYNRLGDRTFVCCCLGEVALSERRLRLANSGCPYPYHYRASTGEVVELSVDAYPLGVRPDTTYPTLEVQLEPSDRIVFCSDGIPETESPQDELFSFERTAEVIRWGCQDNLSAEALLELLLAEVTAFRGEIPQGDDQTVVVLKVAT